ncbi:MAG: hypothetical protein ABIK39_00380 [candidate division WOR-3 bacterium]
MVTRNNIYFYKMTADTGLAPCITGGKILTLALCAKPLRSVAERGDYVIGFSSNRDGARLIYVAKVTKKLCGNAYWGAKYAYRLDCIYEDVNGRATLRANRNNIPNHNTQKDLEYDVGPHFEHGAVLLSEYPDFCYLGAKGTADYKSRYPHLYPVVVKQRRGYCVHHNQKVRGELEWLIDYLWCNFGPGVHSQPTHQVSWAVNHCCHL